jgi:formate/nitrite transporter FocA (FNT family)
MPQQTDVDAEATCVAAGEEEAAPPTQTAEPEAVARRAAPPGIVVYEAIRQEGEDALKRRGGPLAFSGFAAGLSMGFSLVAEGLLRAHLPDQPWRPLVSKFGYAVGFLIVVLARQQLFTENTLTVILPLLMRKNFATFVRVLRLWGIVLAANLAGVALFAFVVAHSDAFQPDARAAFSAVGAEALAVSPGAAMLRGIFAGWLIALMIWLLPYAETARVWVIIILSYLVGIGRLTHIVAGSAEVLYVAFTGAAGFGEVLRVYMLPTLIGNIIGGVALVAVLGHVQFVVHGEDVEI